MKICIVSDTHCQLNKVIVPSADMLLHCGDLTYRGTMEELLEFNRHCGEIKNKFKQGIYYVPGNHDWGFQTNYLWAKNLISNATLILHDLIEIKGINIFMSPY